MRWTDVPFNPSTATLRRFALVACLLLSALAGWHSYRGWWVSATVLAPVVAALAGIACLAPQRLRPVFVGMMIATWPLNWLMTRVILSLVFYGIFTPLGIMFRLAGRDALRRRAQPDAPSYWVPKPPAEGVRSYFRQS